MLHFWGYTAFLGLRCVLGLCAGERPVPRGLLRGVLPPPPHPPAGSAFLPMGAAAS
jgi:hypothetical protein